MYIRHFWGFDLNLYIFNVNLDVNVLIVRACLGAQTCIHMKANTLNDIYFFGRMLYNEFLQNVHLVPESIITLWLKTCFEGVLRRYLIGRWLVLYIRKRSERFRALSSACISKV